MWAVRRSPELTLHTLPALHSAPGRRKAIKNLLKACRLGNEGAKIFFGAEKSSVQDRQSLWLQRERGTFCCIYFPTGATPGSPQVCPWQLPEPFPCVALSDGLNPVFSPWITCELRLFLGEALGVWFPNKSFGMGALHPVCCRWGSYRDAAHSPFSPGALGASQGITKFTETKPWGCAGFDLCEQQEGRGKGRGERRGDNYKQFS